MKKIHFLALSGLLLVAISFSACQKETIDKEVTAQNQSATDLSNGETPGGDVVTERGNANSKVFPPNAHPYGKSYAEWAEVWLQQIYTYDCASFPWTHPSNALFYQTGPVYIMAGIQTVGGSANVTIPHGKALLFPLYNLWLDYPCPAYYNWEPPSGVSIEDWLTGYIESLMPVIDVPSLSVTIDGDPVTHLCSSDVFTDLFEFTGNTDLGNCFDDCITGAPQPAALGGYYVMLKPLSHGQHTVHYHSEAPAWGQVQDATYNITVQ
ncbi:MAG: hypothetical protein IT258_00510 [Saprospiraceae bacterium]|nr:hypothetical protein [Saprospiraceae bacterium]